MAITGWNFDNTYTRLPGILFAGVKPARVASARLVVINQKLCSEMGLQCELTDDAANIFSGNVLPAGAEAIAQAYSGHQFGHYTILGDGRAIVLGEHVDPQRKRRDVQLKGSGRTPYSRRGDGKATLISMLREYLMCEAMYGLAIPTSRGLAVVATGEGVQREAMHKGAVFTRVASSHLRIGTFEFARQHLSVDAFSEFVGYVMHRHYPQVLEADVPALALLRAVMDKQAGLITHWMRVGFIHGVMNTDNTGIAGETFDYGPCAFMNVYNPQTVFSSIDQGGRYAFGNQPDIIHWNMAIFAGTLLPLIHPNQNVAIDMAKEALEGFADLLQNKWLQMMRGKLGLFSEQSADRELVDGLLQWMQESRADYTNTFLNLRSGLQQGKACFRDASFLRWFDQWLSRLALDHQSVDDSVALMDSFNPSVVPRNHRVEEALQAAAFRGDFTLFHTLLEVFSRPYEDHPGLASYQTPPPGGDAHYKTYCGT